MVENGRREGGGRAKAAEGQVRSDALFEFTGVSVRFICSIEYSTA